MYTDILTIYLKCLHALIKQSFPFWDILFTVFPGKPLVTTNDPLAPPKTRGFFQSMKSTKAWLLPTFFKTDATKLSVVYIMPVSVYFTTSSLQMMWSMIISLGWTWNMAKLLSRRVQLFDLHNSSTWNLVPFK